jgi:hypothetical protein
MKCPACNSRLLGDEPIFEAGNLSARLCYACAAELLRDVLRANEERKARDRTVKPGVGSSAIRPGEGNLPRISRTVRLHRRHTEQRVLANELARKPVPDGRGGNRLPTMLEVQRELMSRLGINRRTAQSAARRAVEQLANGPQLDQP